ncbi:MAG TPA: hypothetical protein VNX70_15640 [Bryobacteraceae bacterium]|nr:hypothetical protein [Bryobacteraceae bacterium]
MTQTAKLYAISVAVAGLALSTTFIAAGWAFPETPRFLILLALTSIAAILKVKLPTIEGSMSVLFVFLLIGVATMSLAQTLVLGSIATLLQCAWKPKRRLQPLQVLFNIAAINLSTIAAFYVPNLLAQGMDNPVSLVLSACTFFAVNAGLVSLVISLAEKESLERILRQAYLWSFPYYLIGAGIAGAVSSSTHQVGWKLSLFILPLMYLVYRYYRICLMNRSRLVPATH